MTEIGTGRSRPFAPAASALKSGSAFNGIGFMHLLLVDGSGYIFRAFHALPQLSRKSDGLPVGCVQGF